MDASRFIEQISKQRFFDGQVSHVQLLPERAPVYGNLTGGIAPSLAAVLAERGIDRLYCHQTASIQAVREGKNVVVVTGTASGKTLCYAIPVVETLLEQPMATMLFIYPTKALAQDQLRGFTSLQSELHGVSFTAGTYDGDTPQNLRRKIRDGGNIVLTNPDMLHQGILPQHARWNRFFTHLKYVVIDEIHAYRGVFGSHLANVLRRLDRICKQYGASPQFICSSATISNPRDHAQAVCGVDMVLVDNDGSPRGSKHFVLWNPPPLEQAAVGDQADWRVGGDRRGALGEAVNLMTALVTEGIQTIAFVRTRLAAELIFKQCRDRLRHVSRRLADAVHAYRGGYLPVERREIERRLANREILGVASTNALELGIDIGSLDACILVGYPGTIASLWQQAGRAGRGHEGALVILVAQNAPMDQFLISHADYVFAQNPEQAVVDPDNPHVAVGHLKCATHELPVADSSAESFGPFAEPVLELLEEDGCITHLDNHWYWSSSEFPAANVNLRNIAGPVYTIQDEVNGERVIGTMDEITALSQLHEHAVYLHGAETYFVNRLDIEQKIAFVERKDLDYYTQSVQTSQIQIDERETQRECLRGMLGYGDATVVTSIPMFKKIRFHSRDSLGFEKLELPPQSLETVSLWFAPPVDLVRCLEQMNMVIGDALVGVANVLAEVAPLYVMCDVQDIGTVVDSHNLGRYALFLHDRYPGGMGYARRCFDCFEKLLETIHEVVANCACEDGCPSCVGSAMPSFASTDLDSSVRGRIPDKAAARFLLDRMFGPETPARGSSQSGHRRLPPV